jgi:hypothetical protein
MPRTPVGDSSPRSGRNRAHRFEQKPQPRPRRAGRFEKAQLSRRDEDGGKPRFPQTEAAAKALEKKLTVYMDSMYHPDRQYEVGQDSIHYHSRFHDEMASLAGQLESTFDEAPTEVTEREIKRLRQDLDARLAEWNRIAAEDIPAYNKTAASEGAPTIYSGDPVKIEPVG